MATRGPSGLSSSPEKARPRNGTTPSRGNKLLDPTSQGSSSASPAPVSTQDVDVKAAKSSKTPLSLRHATISAGEMGFLTQPRGGFFLRTKTRRSASLNGSGLSK